MMTDRGMLILVQGLAGSGKSHLIDLLTHDFLIQENFAVDDKTEAQNIEHLIRELRCGRRCIVAERKYRTETARQTLVGRVQAEVQPAPAVQVICFENDLDGANHNCRNRTNKPHDPTGHVRQNAEDTLDYRIPADAIILKVHRIPKKSGSPTATAEQPS